MNTVSNIAVGAASTLVATFILYLFSKIFGRLRKTDRQLTLHLKSQNKLPNLDLGSQSKQLELRWAGQPIDNITVSRFSITNSGKQEIKREDFDGNVNINFPKETLLGISFVDAIPSSLESKAKESLLPAENGFDLKPMLWNPKESIDIMVVTKQAVQMKDCKFNARIASGKVNTIDDRDLTDDKSELPFNIIKAMVATGLLAILLYYFIVTFLKIIP